ncbi:MAG: glycosyltransferase family 4 protein, partial [Sulfuricaulis sp.]|nr:glycosyltransferase family 4 protein [Sulfuricaulis sp.]
VYDLDDNMFDISPLSPHYRDFGIMPVEFDAVGGGKGDLWKQGTGGFDVLRNRQMRKSFIEIIRSVSCVTVTTEPLAKIYRRMNDNVRVIPNSLDFGVWEKPPIQRVGDEVRLLYTGAANHQEDWMFVSTVLADLQKVYPQLKIVLVGMDWNNIKNGIDYKRVEVAPWTDIEAYPYLLQTLCCDIGIAPVSKIAFNECRSSIKWCEYSALKMATVATNYGPYKRDMQDGVTGLLVEEKADWKAALSRLIEDAPYRKQLSEQAFKHCKANYDLDYVVDQWMSAFISVTGRN